MVLPYTHVFYLCSDFDRIKRGRQVFCLYEGHSVRAGRFDSTSCSSLNNKRVPFLRQARPSHLMCFWVPFVPVLSCGYTKERATTTNKAPTKHQQQTRAPTIKSSTHHSIRRLPHHQALHMQETPPFSPQNDKKHNGAPPHDATTASSFLPRPISQISLWRLVRVVGPS